MNGLSTWEVDGVRGLTIRRVYVRAHDREGAVREAKFLFRLRWVFRATQERR